MKAAAPFRLLKFTPKSVSVPADLQRAIEDLTYLYEVAVKSDFVGIAGLITHCADKVERMVTP